MSTAARGIYRTRFNAAVGTTAKRTSTAQLGVDRLELCKDKLDPPLRGAAQARPRRGPADHVAYAPGAACVSNTGPAPAGNIAAAVEQSIADHRELSLMAAGVKIGRKAQMQALDQPILPLKPGQAE
jgi:hypothetical protein